MSAARYGVALLVMLLLCPGTPRAGVLMEGFIEGVPVRFEMGHDRTRVRAQINNTAHLIDLSRDHIYILGDTLARREDVGRLGEVTSALPYELAEWSPGPPVAGHGSRYNVLQLGERICGEVLASRWMLEFLEPIVRSVEIMQKLVRSIRPRPRGQCGAIPFTAYARNGWPLMVGWKDATTFLTTTMRFDHKADPSLFALPRNLDKTAGRKTR